MQPGRSQSTPNGPAPPLPPRPAGMDTHAEHARNSSDGSVPSGTDRPLPPVPQVPRTVSSPFAAAPAPRTHAHHVAPPPPSRSSSTPTGPMAPGAVPMDARGGSAPQKPDKPSRLSTIPSAAAANPMRASSDLSYLTASATPDRHQQTHMSMSVAPREHNNTLRGLGASAKGLSDWREQKTSDTGETFWLNTVTGETSWTAPASMAGSHASLPLGRKSQMDSMFVEKERRQLTPEEIEVEKQKQLRKLICMGGSCVVVIIIIIVVAVTVGGANDCDSPKDGNHATTYNIPVRVHILTSTENSDLNSVSTTSSDIDAWFDSANSIMLRDQVGVELSVESVVTETAQNVAVYEAAVSSDSVTESGVMESVRPQSNTNTDDFWNMYVIHDMPVCGLALTSTSVGRGSFFIRETDCSDFVHVDSQFSVTISHEIGHTLSLEHDNSNDCYVMAQNIYGYIFSSGQVEQARTIAATGRGYTDSDSRKMLRGATLHNPSSGGPSLHQ